MSFDWQPWMMLGAGVLTAAALWWLIGFGQRRSRLLKTLGVALRIAALAAGLRVYVLLDPTAPEIVARTLDAALIFAAAVGAIRVLGLYFFEVHLQQGRGVRMPPLIPPVILGTVYAVTALVTVRISFPELPLQGLLATSAITSLVLGLALQPILANFFAGLVISLENPYRINDWVRLGETEGQVERITWRTTHLTTRDNDNLVVPNSEMAAAQVLNYQYPHNLHMERLYVGVHYRTPPYRAREALLAAVAGIEGVLDKPTPEVYLVEFGDSAIQYEIRVWLEDFGRKPRINSEVNLAIWEEFDRRGIVIPFPIRTLEIEPRVNTLEITRPSPAEQAKQRSRLFVSRGPDRGKSLMLGDEAVVVGRSDECDLALSDRQASGQHFRVEWRENQHVLTDLESTHGTRINGRSVSERRLRHLDRILFGETELVFEQRSS